jgi:hypothetical protein
MSSDRLMLISQITVVTAIAAYVYFTSMKMIYVRRAFETCRNDFTKLLASLERFGKIEFSQHYSLFRNLAQSSYETGRLWLAIEKYLIFPRSFDVNPRIRISQPVADVITPGMVTSIYLNRMSIAHCRMFLKMVWIIAASITIACYSLVLMSKFPLQFATKSIVIPSDTVTHASTFFQYLGVLSISFVVFFQMSAAFEAWIVGRMGRMVESFATRIAGVVEYISTQQSIFVSVSEMQELTKSIQSMIEVLAPATVLPKNQRPMVANTNSSPQNNLVSGISNAPATQHYRSAQPTVGKNPGVPNESIPYPNAPRAASIPAGMDNYRSMPSGRTNSGPKR